MDSMALAGLVAVGFSAVFQVAKDRGFLKGPALSWIALVLGAVASAASGLAADGGDKSGSLALHASIGAILPTVLHSAFFKGSTMGNILKALGDALTMKRKPK